jgi:hypothetical protein
MKKIRVTKLDLKRLPKRTGFQIKNRPVWIYEEKAR